MVAEKAPNVYDILVPTYTAVEKPNVYLIRCNGAISVQCLLNFNKIKP